MSEQRLARAVGRKGVTPTFAHLHVHSEYSLLDGMCKIEALAAAAAKFGQPALALTDHGVMNGALELFTACRRHGLTPIQGCEVYFVDDHRARQPRLERHHLTLLAATQVGYRNLVKLSSAGFLEGYHRGRPTLDLGQLATHAEGVIALTGCLRSRLCQRLVAGRTRDARRHVDDLVQAFGPDNVYFEVQKNGLAEQEKANAGIVRLARELRRRLVGTSDVHYLRREDAAIHAAWLCVRREPTLSEHKPRLATNQFYLRSSEEMAEAFREWPEALTTTVEIAERCDVDVELVGHELIPRYPAPDGIEPDAYLRELVQEGLRSHYGTPPSAAAIERANYELEVIAGMGFSSYFLVVWDYVRFAKEHDVAVGPGRGSVGGSIVAYCLGITEADPLRHGLLFERFVNPGRGSVPDIDVDFSARHRERVVDYVLGRYGERVVARVIAFGRLRPRSATRAAARVLGYGYDEGDQLARRIPDPFMGDTPSFDECLAPGQPLRADVDREPDAKEIIDLARGFDGLLCNRSAHAAALAIGVGPLTERVPLQLVEDWLGKSESGPAFAAATQFTARTLEQFGVLHIDLLGLPTLDVIDDILDDIERGGGQRPDLRALPLDDAATYAMLARGDSDGVFHFASAGMSDTLRWVKPDKFDDLVALLALWHPDALGVLGLYVRNKSAPGAIGYRDERLRPLLSSTRGLVLYQEQIMQIAIRLAGFSPALADELRKAMGKKNCETMSELKLEFVKGCAESAIPVPIGELLWGDCLEASDWAFTKAHPVCYALIAYRMAWLKAHHPHQFMTVLESCR